MAAVPTNYTMECRAVLDGRLTIIGMPDRGTTPPSPNEWVLQRELEKLLYDSETSNGAAYQLLARAGERDGVLTIRGTSVDEGLVKGGFDDLNPGGKTDVVISERICPGVTYEFKMMDHFGDGMCCGSCPASSSGS